MQSSYGPEVVNGSKKIQKLLEFIDAHMELKGLMEQAHMSYQLSELEEMKDSGDFEAIQIKLHEIFRSTIVAESTPDWIKRAYDFIRDEFLMGCREAGIELMQDTYDPQQEEKIEVAGDENPMRKLAQLVEADKDLDIGLIGALRLTHGVASSFFKQCGDPRVDYGAIEILQRTFANLVMSRRYEYIDNLKKKFLKACRMSGINFAVSSSDYCK